MCADWADVPMTSPTRSQVSHLLPSLRDLLHGDDFHRSHHLNGKAQPVRAPAAQCANPSQCRRTERATGSGYVHVELLEEAPRRTAAISSPSIALGSADAHVLVPSRDHRRGVRGRVGGRGATPGRSAEVGRMGRARPRAGRERVAPNDQLTMTHIHTTAVTATG